MKVNPGCHSQGIHRRAEKEEDWQHQARRSVRVGSRVTVAPENMNAVRSRRNPVRRPRCNSRVGIETFDTLFPVNVLAAQYPRAVVVVPEKKAPTPGTVAVTSGTVSPAATIH